MKKFTTICLLFILFFNAGGYVSGYLILKYILKQNTIYQIKEKKNYSNSEIVKFTFTKNQFVKILEQFDNQEFELNNLSYDIVSCFETNNKVLVYCLADEKEDILKDYFDELNDNEDSNKNKSIVKSFIKMIQTEGFISSIHLSKNSVIISENFIIQCLPLCTTDLKKTDKPPQIFS